MIDLIVEVLRNIAILAVLFLLAMALWSIRTFIANAYMNLYHEDGGPANGPIERLFRFLRLG